MFHEQTKHIEINGHFVHKKIQQKRISTGHVKIKEQLGNIFTKTLYRIELISDKLGRRVLWKLDIYLIVNRTLTIS